MTMANVIDISEYQDPAKFDYQAAKSNGIKAVIIRLSVGNRRDNHAAEHIANCKKYGLKWHGYHYWYNLSGEAAFAVSDAQSLGLTSSQYFFLDMEDKSLSSDWSVQFESFRSAVGSKYKIGLYCSDSPYKSHFDNAKMVAEGVYRWIAAYSYEPANYDTWQMSGEGSGGFGSYTGDVDRDYDKTGSLFKEEAQPITPSTTPLYRQIIGEAGYDTDSGIYGLGRSYDNGKTFHVMDTVYGRIYRQQDGDSIWPFLVNKVKAVLDWSNITNKPDLALKTDLTWSNVTGKPDVALKSDVAAVSAVASSASDKADSNAKLIAGKAGQADLDNVSKTASSALDKATSNANALAGKVNKADLTWTNITNRPDFDKVASQANQAKNTANTASATATQAKSTADNVNNRLWSIQANGGGRNLLHGTSGDWITKTATSWMNVTTANSNKTSVADYRTGDKFTYSAMVLNKSNVNVRLELYCCDNNGNRLNGDSHHALSDYVAPNTTAKRISCTITIDSNTWYVEHTLIADGGTSTSKTVKIKGEMFETGTIAHDWSPALEDIQYEIDANKTATANAQNTANSALSKANSNATALNSKANKSDLTWANISGKPSIPNADDTTTVSSGDLNNYTTTGKYYMPNALSNYTNHPTTGTDMGDWFVMKVDAYHSGDMIVQTIYQINSGDVWIRQRWSGAWKSWRQINFWG